MGIATDIEWADSTLNLQMGCDGCELWNRKAGIKHCYAGTLTERYGGRKGWPEAFDKPAIFAGRLKLALRWPDITGQERPDKPWLNGLPRIIFLNDMGDTFTESLPLDWLAPMLPQMSDSPHHYLILTKRGSRLRKFASEYELPPNVWPGVSITTERTIGRVAELANIRSGGPKWISAEPLLGAISLGDDTATYCHYQGAVVAGECEHGLACRERALLDYLDLVIVGGESGSQARPCSVAWIRDIVQQCGAAGVPCFVKQLGSFPVDGEPLIPPRGNPLFTVNNKIRLKHKKGGDIAEFPDDLRVRQFPATFTPAGQ